MALTVVSDSEGALLGPAVLSAIEAALDERRTVTVIVPSMRAALDMRRGLARRGIGVGVDVTCPVPWADALWGRLGDGSVLASGADVCAMAWKVLGGNALADGRPESAGVYPGYVDVVARLAGTFSAQIDQAAAQAAPSLSPQQRDACAMAVALARALRDQGLATRSQVFEALPDAVAAHPGEARCALVAAGWEDMDASMARLFGRLAKTVGLTWALSAHPGPAGDAARACEAAVAREAAQAGAAVESAPAAEPAAPRHRAPRSPELQGLLDSVFGTGDPVEPTGSVRLLEAAGPEAEPELIARELGRLAEAGAERVMLVSRNARETWRTVSPKASNRGIVVRASWSEPASELRATRLFLAFVEQLSAVAAAASQWRLDRAADGASDSAEAAEDVLSASVEADRSWWPPRAVTDFLLSELSGLPRDIVFSLDAAWRQNRSLSPAAVLADVSRVASKSEPLAHAVEQVLAGDWAGAARSLRPCAQAARDREAHQALCAVEDACAAIDALFGGSLDPHARLTVLSSVLASMGVARSPERGRYGEAQRCTVEICDPARAAVVAPASVDAVVLVGQTADEDPVTAPHDALHGLLDLLGLARAAAPDAVARARARHVWSAPTHALIVERSMRNASADQTHPSPLFAELLSCYRERPETVVLGEERVSKNLSPQGREPEPAAFVPPLERGQLSEKAAQLAVMRADVAQGVPVVSATDLETYLACPRRWFLERAVPASRLDADFSGLDRGSFAHGVLERTMRELAAQGSFDHDHAAAVLSRVFDEAVAAAPLGTGPAAGFVPHSVTEESQVRHLKEQLLGALDRNGSSFLGFVPRLFEQTFGNPGQQPVTYAGVRVRGTIDRVDTDAQGRAVVIDYKSGNSGGARYRPEPADSLAAWVPRHIQALLYASVLPQVAPGLLPVGAVYFTTGDDPGIGGMAEHGFAAAVEGPSAGKNPNVVTPDAVAAASFEDVLARAEEVAAQAVAAMAEGHVEARPRDALSCAGCPAVSCEKRIDR
ncbi:PD-(D/E)XK nuclease family protein [Atopobiaceae bacterium 24-176]